MYFFFYGKLYLQVLSEVTVTYCITFSFFLEKQCSFGILKITAVKNIPVSINQEADDSKSW